MNNTQTQVQYEDRLEKLGFKRAATNLKITRERKRKLMLAYEHYRFVRQENVNRFNEKLKDRTLEGSYPYSATWQTLAFCPVGNYGKIPPQEALSAMEAAVERKCFDTFEVAYIDNVKDPILFGRVEGCPDRFFVAQWDDDVKIEDLLKENEG